MILSRIIFLFSHPIEWVGVYTEPDPSVRIHYCQHHQRITSSFPMTKDIHGQTITLISSQGCEVKTASSLAGIDLQMDQVIFKNLGCQSISTVYVRIETAWLFCNTLMEILSLLLLSIYLTSLPKEEAKPNTASNFSHNSPLT